MAKIGLTDVLANPDAAVRALDTLDCVDSVSVQRSSEDRITLGITLLPHDSAGVFISEGYPVETVNIVIRPDGQIHAVPKSGLGRSWKHRNGPTDLCLWDPRDPAELRWSWDDGLEEYVRIVTRHLIYEEYWRRTDEWPVEDSPHGDPLGAAWPIRTREMRTAVKRSRLG